MPTPLTPPEIAAELRRLPDWTHAGNSLVRELKFPSFRAAIDFMLRASFLADAMNHHPEWTNVYDRVTIRLRTHDAGNKVTAQDVELARRFQKLCQTQPAP